MSFKITYYLATSVDGFLATPDGGVDWLEPFSGLQENGKAEDYGYHDFFASVDTLIMGRKTYDQVLSFGEWPYGDKPCWVLTQNLLEAPLPSIQPFTGSPKALTEQLRRETEHAWLVGGGALAASFAAAKLIDEYLISIMPCLLGQGIGIFGSQGASFGTSPVNLAEQLELQASRRYDNGVMQLQYSRKSSSN